MQIAVSLINNETFCGESQSPDLLLSVSRSSLLKLMFYGEELPSSYLDWADFQSLLKVYSQQMCEGRKPERVDQHFNSIQYKKVGNRHSHQDESKQCESSSRIPTTLPRSGRSLASSHDYLQIHLHNALVAQYVC